MIVCKFGGTSVKDAANMRKVAEIISSDSNRRLIVLSATAGTTNQLNEIADAIANEKLNDNFIGETFQFLRERHRNLYLDLMGIDPSDSLEELFYTLEQTINTAINSNKRKMVFFRSELLSFGERISTLIFTDYLNKLNMNAELFDVKRVMHTSKQEAGAMPDFKSIDALALNTLLPLLSQKIVVTQGFVGRDYKNRTTVLGRGGSDYSASILAAATFATNIEIWTDVAGIKSSDPRFVENTIAIKGLSYKEAAELSNFGAKVIHPLTLGPVQRKRIPVFIKSTFEPELRGTEISEHPIDERPVKAIAKRDHQTLLTLSSLKMIGAPGFLAKVFQTLSKFEMNVDLVTTSEASVAITLDGNNNGYGTGVQIEPKLIQELQKFCHLKIENNLSLIALIGNRPDGYFSFAEGMSLIKEMRVRLFCQGASLHNVCFLVPSHNVNTIMNHLHSAVIDPEVRDQEVYV